MYYTSKGTIILPVKPAKFFTWSVLIGFLIITTPQLGTAQKRGDLFFSTSVGFDLGHAIFAAQETAYYDSYYWDYLWVIPIRNPEAYSTKIRGLAMYGFGFEKLISDQVGIGLNLYYSPLEIQFEGSNTLLNTTISKNKTLLLPKAVFHLTPGRPRFDMYIPVMMGLKVNDFQVESNFSRYESPGESMNAYTIGFRTCLGIRGQLSKNILLGGEIFGLGGAIFSVKLTIRIPGMKETADSEFDQ